MSEFLCVRELKNETSDNRDIVTVSIGKPERRNEGEFLCPFQVVGLENSDLQYAYGVDCFQALIMALEGIRAILEKSGKSLTWIGGQKGDHGFPGFVPSFYGLDFSRHLHGVIANEIKRFTEKAQRRS